MARTPQDVLRDQLGSLMVEVAILTAQKEKLQEELDAVKAQAGNVKPVREPDKIPNLKEVK